MENEKTMHTISNPLKLIWKGSEYKVNKPNQDTQELVSKELAEELLSVLGKLIDNGYQIPSNTDMNNAVKVYNKAIGLEKVEMPPNLSLSPFEYKNIKINEQRTT